MDSLFKITKIQEQAIREFLNTCKLFGNLPDFSSLPLKSTGREVMSPCLQIMLFFEVCSYLFFNK
jgi:hypothetical protein